MMGASGSLRTSPPAPPPPGTGVTSSPFDPLWDLAPPAFFSVDTNRTGLADDPHAPPAEGLIVYCHAFPPINDTLGSCECNSGLL